MSAPPGSPDRGGGLATTVLLGSVACFFGFLGGLPLPFGPVLGALGAAGSAAWRTYGPGRSTTAPLVPALVVLVVLTVTSPAGPATELFAGLTGLALLLWVADDPARPSGGGRRAASMIAPAALGVGMAWAITLAWAGRPQEVGVAGGLLAIALVLLAFLVATLPRRTPAVPDR